MIQNLNPISFKSYGIILNSSIQKNSDSESRLTLTLAQGQIPVRLSQQHVQLFPNPGLCVLSVSRDGENYAHYYLDKPVELENGIRFFLSPLHFFH